MTNWDKIKQMSAVEFTKRRHLIACESCEQIRRGFDPLDCTKETTSKWWVSPCDDCFLNWLEREVEE